MPPTEWPARPTRCRNALIERVDPIWQTRSTSPMSMPSSSEAVATSAFKLAALQALLGIEPAVASEAAMMRGDVLLADPFGQMSRHALGQPPRVDEHQRGAVLAGELGEPVVDLRPDLARHHRFQRRRRQLQREIPAPRVPGVDDGARRSADGAGGAHGGPRTGQEARDLLDGLLRRRQSDPHQRPRDDRLQPLER